MPRDFTTIVSGLPRSGTSMALSGRTISAKATISSVAAISKFRRVRTAPMYLFFSCFKPGRVRDMGELLLVYKTTIVGQGMEGGSQR